MSEFVAASPWARSQFGLVASEVGRRVVQALGEAQVIGSRTQKASGLRHRYPYGSTWISKFDLLVRHLEDLPSSAVVEVPKAVYRLVEINGRILIPFVLARSLAEIPQRARLTSDVLRAEAATTVPRPPEPDALFDLGTQACHCRVSVSVPAVINRHPSSLASSAMPPMTIFSQSCGATPTPSIPVG